MMKSSIRDTPLKVFFVFILKVKPSLKVNETEARLSWSYSHRFPKVDRYKIIYSVDKGEIWNEWPGIIIYF